MTIGLTDTLSIEFHTEDKLTAETLSNEFSLTVSPHKTQNTKHVFFVENKHNSHIRRGKAFKAKASQRYYLISLEGENVYVYLSRFHAFGDFFFRLINPFRESRKKMSLIDFLHNAFLGLVETWLLKEDATLFHCCGFNKDPLGIRLVVSGPQCGKTALVTSIKDEYKILCEDFGIVKGNRFYPLPLIKQKRHYEPVTLFEKANRFICKLLRREAGAFETFKACFGIDSIESGPIDRIYLLTRDKPISNKSEMCDAIYRIMENEIHNFSFFETIVRSFLAPTGYEDIFQSMGKLISSICERGIVNLYIPFEKEIGAYTRKARERLGE